MTSEATARLRFLPAIRRARGFRLYTSDGRRLLDLWQAGGEAIVGHRGGGIVTAAKRVLDRGVLAPLPSSQQHRLEQAMRALLPAFDDYALLVFANRERAARALGGGIDGLTGVVDPVVEIARAGDVPAAATGVVTETAVRARAVLWRPGLDEVVQPDAYRRFAAIVPVLATGGMIGAHAVLVRRDQSVGLTSDLLPEPVLAMLTAGAHALVSFGTRPMVDLDGFATVGPYRVPVSDEGYDARFRRFLEAGVVISPDPVVPSVVPAELSDGEADVLRSISRGEGMHGN
ncbi:MAG: hypothetical protein ACOC1U_00340 [Spirochaetota bacterium]